MLHAQYIASAHAITATELAAAASYKSYHGANLQYGLMSYRLRERLSYWDVIDIHSYALSWFIEPGAQNNPEWLFVMHPEVAQALRELQWFPD